MPFTLKNLSPNAKAVLLIVAMACFNVVLKTSTIGMYQSDGPSYIETAQMFDGHTVETVYPQRILKPLAPILISIGAKLNGGNYYLSFAWQNILFYAALSVLAYCFFKKFFSGTTFPVLAALVFICSGPALRAGLSTMTESGAWFFYVLGLYLAILYHEKPGILRLLAVSTAVIIGFFYKEYTAMVAVFFVYLVFFDRRQPPWMRLAVIAAHSFFFAASLLPYFYHVYAKYGYTYVDWLNTAGHIPLLKILYNISKSLFAVFFIGWLPALYGFKKLKAMSPDQLYYLKGLLLIAPMIFLWGATDSRLYFVIAPVFIIPLVKTIEWLHNSGRKRLAIALTITIIATPYIWLFAQGFFRGVLDI